MEVGKWTVQLQISGGEYHIFNVHIYIYSIPVPHSAASIDSVYVQWLRQNIHGLCT